MTLKKSEKILLQILILFAAFAAILVFLVMPEMERKLELDTQAEELELELIEKQQLMNNPTLEENYQTQRALAEENANYFYSVLNGYSIDEIVNEVAQEKDLFIKYLSIEPYQDASGDFVATTGQESDVLVKSTINLTVLGNYQNILEYMDALNAKSTCLRMSLVSLSENQNDATGTQEMSGVFNIYIYGIDVELTEEGTIEPIAEEAVEVPETESAE